MEEAWRAIPDEAGYEVSDLGRVRSLWRSGTNRGAFLGETWRIVKGRTHKSGYRVIGIHSRMRRIHCLVLIAFVGPRPAGMECRHLDGDKTNNRLSNICWDSHSNNEKDKKRHGTFRVGDRSRRRNAS